MSTAPPAARWPKRAQSGQVAVLLAVTLAVLLGATAIVIDVGYAYYVQRSLQASADAAALAGASGLPDAGQATSLAEEYGGSADGKNHRDNLPPVTTSATTKCVPIAPCSPVNAVVVEETTEVPARFARIFGFDTFTVSVQATACSPCGMRPLDVMLVLDRTLSMCMTHSGGFDWSCSDLRNAREGMLEFLGYMDPDLDWVGLAVLPPARDHGDRCDSPSLSTSSNYDRTSAPYVLVPLSNDYKVDGELNDGSLLVSTIECVRGGGVTSYANALEHAQAELDANGRPEAEDVIVFLSDGAANYGPDYYSNSSPYRMQPCHQGVSSAAAIKAAGTTVYSIGYDLNAQDGGANVCESYRGDPEQPSISAYSALQQIASTSDTFYDQPAPGELRSIYTAIAGEISGSRLID